MLKKILFVVSVLAVARAQIPSLGWCPEYIPMANFDMGKFLGVWYEAERYFQLSEVVSRCVMANYTKGPDGKLRVSNEVTNRFTGIKRILEGEIRAAASKAEEGKLHVKYTTVPLTPETQYAVLETDYKNYAVLWSCSGIGPVHAQNAWLMTRTRRPAGEILQQAYGVLDKYKISKTFFVKTDQDDCAYLDTVAEVAKPIEKPTEKPVVEEAVEEAPSAKSAEFNLRSAIIPDAPAVIIETRKAEIAAAAVEPAVQAEAAPEIPIAEPVEALEELEKELNTVEKVPEVEIAAPPASVPEVILKVADRAKETAVTVTELKKLEEDEKINETDEKINETVEKFPDQSQEALEKPAKQLPEFIQKPLQQLQDAFQKPAEQFQEFIQNPVEQFQAAIQGPIEQFQAAIQGPVNQFQAVIQNPAEQFQAVFQPKPEVPVEKPAEAAKETLNEPAAVVAETLPKEIKEQEAPKDEKIQDNEKKIES